MKNQTTISDKVNDYMNKLEHPLKFEIEALRTIIKDSSSNIAERIKWNAPSYYYSPGQQDLVTFNPRAIEHVHLVFHHAAIVNIHSALLKGDYKDRRMAYFTDMADVKSKKKELEIVLKELVDLIKQ